MALPIASGQLARPTRPKLKDVDAERALRELEAKIVELQDLVRQLAARSP